MKRGERSFKRPERHEQEPDRAEGEHDHDPKCHPTRRPSEDGKHNGQDEPDACGSSAYQVEREGWLVDGRLVVGIHGINHGREHVQPACYEVAHHRDQRVVAKPAQVDISKIEPDDTATSRTVPMPARPGVKNGGSFRHPPFHE